MLSEILRITTGGRRVTDLTDRVGDFARRSGGDGLVHVFAPHATAGLALMETGSGSETDLDDLLERLLPRDDRYTHHHGSRGHGCDHLLPVLVAPSLALPVLDAAGKPKRVPRSINRRQFLRYSAGAAKP